MAVVSYFLREIDLEGVDIIGLWQTLRAIGYKIFIGKGIRVVAEVGRFESKEHVQRELIVDIESLLRRFRIKK